MGSNSQVKGNITARGDIAIGEGASVTGEVQPLCDNIPEIAGFPELDGKHFLEQAGQQEGQFFGEKETPKIFSGHDLANISGIYYVSGDVIIDPDGVEYYGDAVIFAEGKISVHSDLFPRDNDSSLALISSGDLELNNAAICGVVIAGGRLKVSGKPGGITGVAAIANMSNYCLNDFTYRKDILKGLEQYLGLEGSGIKLEIWRELYDIY